MQAHHLPQSDDLVPAAIPVEYLTQTILQREKRSPRELSRCRAEVLLQLAFSPPWPEADEPDAAHRPPAPMNLKYLARPITASG